MTTVPKKLSDQARNHLERIKELADYGLSAERMHHEDPAEWYRTILRAVADIRDESRTAERELSDSADKTKCLSPTEISRAAKISTAALYKRRSPK
jgi:hypothetical protein